jgi:hypothetical protein
MAIQEEPHSRPSSTEKGDIEKVEEIKSHRHEVTGSPEVPIEMTWKTWAVIFVSTASPIIECSC